MFGDKCAKTLSVSLSLAIVLTAPGMAGWSAFAGDISAQYDPKRHTITTTEILSPQVDGVIQEVDEAVSQGRLSKDQAAQMKQFLSNNKSAFKDSESPDAQAALKELTADLNDKNKDLGLAFSQAYDRLSRSRAKAARATMSCTSSISAARARPWKSPTPALATRS